MSGECNPNHCGIVIQQATITIGQELKIKQLEQEKAELIECLKDFTEDRLDISIYYDKCNELLNKYKGG